MYSLKSSCGSSKSGAISNMPLPQPKPVFTSVMSTSMPPHLTIFRSLPSPGCGAAPSMGTSTFMVSAFLPLDAFGGLMIFKSSPSRTPAASPKLPDCRYGWSLQTWSYFLSYKNTVFPKILPHSFFKRKPTFGHNNLPQFRQYFTKNKKAALLQVPPFQLALDTHYFVSKIVSEAHIFPSTSN